MTYQQARRSADGFTLGDTIEFATILEDLCEAGEPTAGEIRERVRPVRIRIEFCLEPFDVDKVTTARLFFKFVQDVDDAIARCVIPLEAVEAIGELLVQERTQLLVIAKQEPAMPGLEWQGEVEAMGFSCFFDDGPIE